jgi:hypothetical protein
MYVLYQKEVVVGRLYRGLSMGGTSKHDPRALVAC